ncbi:MAG: tRNA 2-thiouridine(34) synthase MnmA [Clostridia bacterium]|nr:tRNA 2-thiouridine(34) synthase MnmA [Clostridia bacterium]
MPRALVAMSGGVDSAASALLMQQMGYDVCGVTLILNSNYDDAEGAKATAQKLGIDHYSLEAEDVFSSLVIDSFVSEYCEGRTPNPCILCNKHIKFGVLYQEMVIKNFDVLATGHYATVDWDDERYEPRLRKGADINKDQSYVLYSVARDKLKNVVFPLGDKTKDQVRAILKDAGIDCCTKAESQDICFVPDGDYAGFIKQKTDAGTCCGNFCNTQGEIVGKHNGLINYTVGQRRGLGVPAQESYYVLKKDAQSNTITLGFKNELMTDTFCVRDINVLCPSLFVSGNKYSVRTRYHQNETECSVVFEDNGVKVITDTQIRIPAPGQSAVFYLDDVVVAGGIIY